jgi:hypothetical protein
MKIILSIFLPAQAYAIPCAGESLENHPQTAETRDR